MPHSEQDVAALRALARVLEQAEDPWGSWFAWIDEQLEQGALERFAGAWAQWREALPPPEPAQTARLLLQALRLEEAAEASAEGLDPALAADLQGWRAAPPAELELLVDALAPERSERAEFLTRVGRTWPTGAARAGALHWLARDYAERWNEPEAALACALQALDLDWRRQDSFELAHELLFAAQDWLGLEEHQRAMLQRVPAAERELRAALWANLGRLYQLHLGQPEEAALAYQTALGLAPRSAAVLGALAELEAQVGVLAPERRVVLHRSLLLLEPGRTESLRELGRALSEAGDGDGAWCCAARLVAEGVAEPFEEALYFNLRRPAPPRLPAIPEGWWSAWLRHPDCDPSLDALLAALAPVLNPALRALVRPAAVNKLPRVPSDAPLPANDCLGRCLLAQSGWAPGTRAAASAAVAPPQDPAGLPELRRGPGAECHLHQGEPPVLELGQDLFAGVEPRRLLAVMAPRTVDLRPERSALALLPAESWPWLLSVVLHCLDEAWPAPSDAAGQRLRRELSAALPPAARAALAPLAQGLRDQPLEALCQRHAQGLGASALRFGLLVSEALDELLPTLEDPALRADLLAFSISGEYLALRRSLGLSLEPQPER